MIDTNGATLIRGSRRKVLIHKPGGHLVPHYFCLTFYLASKMCKKTAKTYHESNISLRQVSNPIYFSGYDIVKTIPHHTTFCIRYFGLRKLLHMKSEYMICDLLVKFGPFPRRIKGPRE
jgi:hypothetical protein